MLVDVLATTRRFMMAIVFLAWMATPSGAQSDSQIKKLHQQWMTAFAAGDGSLAAMYTEDAYILPMCGPPVKGSNAIANFWRDQATYFESKSLETVTIQSFSSTTALEIGKLSFQPKKQMVAPPSCVPKKEQYVGNYVVLWRKVHGQWKLAIDIWNSRE